MNFVAHSTIHPINIPGHSSIHCIGWDLASSSPSSSSSTHKGLNHLQHLVLSVSLSTLSALYPVNQYHTTQFLATLVALHSTPLRHWVGQSFGLVFLMDWLFLMSYKKFYQEVSTISRATQRCPLELGLQNLLPWRFRSLEETSVTSMTCQRSMQVHILTWIWIVCLSLWVYMLLIGKALSAGKYICIGEDIAQYPPNYLQSKPPHPWGTIDHWKGGRSLVFQVHRCAGKCGCTYFCVDQYHLT